MLKHILLAVLGMVIASASAANFTVEQTPDGLQITPPIAFVRADLDVTGPLGTQILGFESGQTILIPLPGLDGHYKFELVLTPQLTLAQQQALAANRANGSDATIINQALTQYSGSFGVSGNALAATLAEPGSDDNNNNSPVIPDPQPMVVLTTTDGVIQGSLCVGFDCPASPSFGSDTIRLQENNLRIHFDDTSNSSSFPNNDWRLVANDSVNGGANLFALEDATAGRRIAVFEAGAPANSLYVEDTGDIGINTNNPVVELHVADGDSPTLRLDQNGSAGFGTQVWDVAGNETNFFIRDATNGSQLVFRIQPGAQDASLIIDSQGQVGVGSPNGSTLQADATLHVRSRGIVGQPVLLVEDRTASTALLTLADSGDMILSGTLAQLSRRDSKEHFSSIDHKTMLTALKGLDISTWNYKHQNDNERHLGPMAEAFYATYGLGADPEHIATSDMAAVALASSQALLFELEAKDQRITELETRLQRLEALMVQVLKQQVDQDTRQIVSH